MKIMKIEFMTERSECDWDGGNQRRYMGEQSWAVGEKFNGEYIKGTVYQLLDDEDGMIDLWVEDGNAKIHLAISFPIHAVNRIYYGE